VSELELGIDYASVDGDRVPDLVAAKATGLRFAFIRGCWAKWADATFARDCAAIRAAGLVLGAYMGPAIGDAYPSPEEQVALLPELESGDFAPVLDVEFPAPGISATRLKPPQIAAWLARARAAIVTRYGCDPIVYSSARVLDGDDTDGLAGAANDALRGCAPWLARYPFATRIPAQLGAMATMPAAPPAAALGPAWIRQPQGDALRFPGFSATVDLDVFFGFGVCARGERVRWVQARIGTDVDGDFGAETELALQAWQGSHGLPMTGAVDVVTFARLSRVLPRAA
jgi:lysozyme